MFKMLRSPRVRVFGVLLIMALVLASACASSGNTEPESTAQQPETSTPDTSTSEGPQAGGELVVAVEQNPVSLDPQFVNDVGSARGIFYMFDTLVAQSPEGEIEPMLAESWDVSPDGMEYTFRLRKDVTFHDGTPLNAEAVKFNFDRNLNPDVNTRHFSFADQYIEGVEVVDDYTVKLTLKQLNVDLLEEFTDVGWGMISPTAVEKYGEDFALHPVGTGPFKFSDYEQDSHLLMVRNDEYWGGKPYLDAIRLRIIPEHNVQILETIAGNVDFAFTVQAKDAEKLEQAGVNVVGRITPTATFISMNLAKKPTSELAVRQAIALSVDREAIISELLLGYGELSRGGQPEGWPRYHADVPMDTYDPEKAGQILEDAGWKLADDGIRYRDGQPLAVKVLSTQLVRALDYGLMNQIIQEALTKIGFKTEIATLEWGSYLDAFRAGDWDVTFHAQNFGSQRTMVGADLDPEHYWNVNQHAKATEPYLMESADKVRELWARDLATLDDEVRFEQWKELQMLVEEQKLVSWLVHWEWLYGVSPKVHDLTIKSTTTDTIRYQIEKAWIEH